MTIDWSCYYFKAFIRNLASIKAVTAILSSFGALWLLVEITTFFFPTTVILGNSNLPEIIRRLWPFFFLSGLAFAAWQCRPRLSICHKLKGRDVSIDITVGDIFSLPGALIIGSNRTFDTMIPRVISPKSVQGIFINRYYSQAQIDAEVVANLHGVSFEQLAANRASNTKQYPMGTCVLLRPKERTGYLLAIASINEHGVALATFENLKDALAKLWEFIGTHGTKEPLLIPVLGTGFARLPQSREEIVREIVRSFLAACSERTFTDKLTIVILPRDLLDHQISLDELASFLRHECTYTVFSSGNRAPIGTAA